MFWVISVYFNIRNTLPKSDTFFLGHLVYEHMSLESDPIISCVIYVLCWAGFCLMFFNGFCRIKLVCFMRDTMSHPISSLDGMMWYFKC